LINPAGNVVPLETAPRTPRGIAVSLAAFGTLANGSDVRFLAEPDGMTLSAEAKSRIEAFFYAAWKALAERKSPYFAFFRLDETEGKPGAERLWGLARVCAMGRGAAGEILVVWVAILTEAQLDSIGWQTHRLLDTGFPSPIYLPEPGTRLRPHSAQLYMDDPAVVTNYYCAIEWLIVRMVTGKLSHIGILVERPAVSDIAPLSADGVLFGVLSRLGAERVEKSYCTWAGIERYGFPPSGDHFNIALDDSGTGGMGARTPRELVSLGKDPMGGRNDFPSEAEDIARFTKTQLPSLRGMPDQEPTPENIAAALAYFIRDDELEQREEKRAPNSFEMLSKKMLRDVAWMPRNYDRVFAQAFPDFLRYTVDRLAPKRRLKAAEAVNCFVEFVLPRMELVPGTPDCRPQILKLAEEHGLLAILSKNSLQAISPLLFNDDGDDFHSYIALVSQVGKAAHDEVDWGQMLVLAQQRVSRDNPMDGRFVSCVIRGCWRDPSLRAPSLGLIQSFADRYGPGYARGLLNGLSGEVYQSLCRAIVSMRPYIDIREGLYRRNSLRETFGNNIRLVNKLRPARWPREQSRVE
jgi:hypothetical protein